MDYKEFIIKLYNESILFKILIVMILCILILKIYKKKSEPFTNSLSKIAIYDDVSDSFKINYEIDKLSNYIPLQSKILDIECSTGQYVHKLSSYGYNVSGIDRKQKNIDYCLNKYSYPFKQSDLMNTIIYPSQSFDNILCMNLSIYKLQNINVLLENIYDWLISGGYLYMYCVDDLYPLFNKKHNINHVKLYNPKLTQISNIEYSLKEYIEYDKQTYYYETPLYFYSKNKLITIAKEKGFIVDNMIQLNKNESIYRLKKPN
jgi:SAM-dependent methyltransferase